MIGKLGLPRKPIKSGTTEQRSQDTREEERSYANLSYMFLGNFHYSTDACNVNHARSVPGDIFASFREETQERGGNEKDRESVDFIEFSPSLK